MIIAISASEPVLQSMVDPLFGRSAYFAVYDTENKGLRFIENGHKDSPKEAGRLAAEELLGLGVTVIAAGRFGNKAVELLRLKGIQMVISAKGQKVEDIINRIK